MQFGVGNDAGGDSTGLTSTSGSEVLDVQNGGDGTTVAIRANGAYMGVVASAAAYPLFGYTTSGTTGTGVYGRGSWGVHGRSYRGDGVFGDTDTGNGVKGSSFDDSATAAGVYGLAYGRSSNGIIGQADNGTAAYGVWGKSTVGYAGFFSGRVSVTGLLTKAGGGFRIDHPLDPENRYLSHSFVESSEQLNVYSGTTVTDARGRALVELPEYFESLNTDVRYQLTAIGDFAQAIVAEEVNGNRFTIATDRPGVKVSWQVSGVRRDPFARANPVVVEEEKPAEERGTYLHPAAWGRPESEGADHARSAALRERQVGVPDRDPVPPDATRRRDPHRGVP